MKKIIIGLLAALSMLFSGNYIFASGQAPVVEGRVLDENGSPVGYATIILLTKDSEQAAGAVSDAEGKFTVSAPAGEYTLKVIFLGYEEETRSINLSSRMKLADISLRPVSTQIESVKVAARAIVREADRFVVTVANTVGAIGKDAFELLKTSPGVWINGSDITINGRAGTRVMVNDRMLRMTGDDLETYLRSIKAEDILKIEIIPEAGADYDADSSGGIIKITLAKKRNDGLDGNVTLNGGGNYQGNWRVSPSAGINYQAGKLNLYGNIGYTRAKSVGYIDETTKGFDTEGVLRSTTVSDSEMIGEGDNYGGRLGGVYDFDAKNSVGAEFSIYRNDADALTTGKSVTDLQAMSYNMESIYKTDRKGNNYSGTVNYIRKLDEKGSVFKLIGDYAASTGKEFNDNKETLIVPGTASIDSLGRINSESKFSIYSINANVDLVRSPTTVFKMGAKYAFNNIYSPIMAEKSVAGEPWSMLESQSSITDYSENIGALYFIYSGRLGKVGISAGLRGEYTSMRSKYRETYNDNNPTVLNKGYFDLFPNLNVSVPLNSTYSNTLVFSYSRNISRPHFSYLSPFRNQLSSNSYISGNPDLKPMYANNISITGVFAYKYSLTLGASINQNQIMQEVIKEENLLEAPVDDKDNTILVYKFMNIASNVQLFASLNAPITITDWWTANVNVTGMQMNQKLEKDDPYRSRFTVFGNISTNLSIPKWFDVELSYMYMSRFLNANMEQMPAHYVNASLKRRFADNKFTASLTVNNLFFVLQKVHSFGDGFDKWAHVDNGNHLSVMLSLRYNFNAGVKFRAKTVEKAADDDIKRLNGGGN